VQDARGDDLVVEAAPAQQHGDLERAQDEGRVVDVTALVGVHASRPLDGLAHDWTVVGEGRLHRTRR